jgi:hypothetical protein
MQNSTSPAPTSAAPPGIPPDDNTALFAMLAVIAACVVVASVVVGVRLLCALCGRMRVPPGRFEREGAGIAA